MARTEGRPLNRCLHHRCPKPLPEERSPPVPEVRQLAQARQLHRQPVVGCLRLGQLPRHLGQLGARRGHLAAVPALPLPRLLLLPRQPLLHLLQPRLPLGQLVGVLRVLGLGRPLQLLVRVAQRLVLALKGQVLQLQRLHHATATLAISLTAAAQAHSNAGFASARTCASLLAASTWPSSSATSRAWSPPSSTAMARPTSACCDADAASRSCCACSACSSCSRAFHASPQALSSCC